LGVATVLVFGSSYPSSWSHCVSAPHSSSFLGTREHRSHDGACEGWEWHWSAWASSAWLWWSAWLSGFALFSGAGDIPRHHRGPMGNIDEVCRVVEVSVVVGCGVGWSGVVVRWDVRIVVSSVVGLIGRIHIIDDTRADLAYDVRHGDPVVRLGVIGVVCPGPWQGCGVGCGRVDDPIEVIDGIHDVGRADVISVGRRGVAGEVGEGRDLGRVVRGNVTGVVLDVGVLGGRGVRGVVGSVGPVERIEDIGHVEHIEHIRYVDDLCSRGAGMHWGRLVCAWGCGRDGSVVAGMGDRVVDCIGVHCVW